MRASLVVAAAAAVAALSSAAAPPPPSLVSDEWVVRHLLNAGHAAAAADAALPIYVK